MELRSRGSRGPYVTGLNESDKKARRKKQLQTSQQRWRAKVEGRPGPSSAVKAFMDEEAAACSDTTSGSDGASE